MPKVKKAIREVYSGRVYEQRDDSVKREEMEFVVPDNKVKEVLERVQLAAATDEGADGRIYVSALEESVHVHNGKEHSGDRNESDLDL